MAPLPGRDPAKVREVLAPSLGGLLKLDGKLAEPALALVMTYGLDLSSVDDDSLKALVMNAGLPGAARAEALDLYAGRKPAGLDDLLGELAKGTDDDLAIGAIKRLAVEQPAAALEALKAATSTAARGASRKRGRSPRTSRFRGLRSSFSTVWRPCRSNTAYHPPRSSC